MKSINIPDTVQELGYGCLEYTPIETLRLPNSVESLGFLGNMLSLKKIYIESASKLKTIDQRLFGSIPSRRCLGPSISLPNIETIDISKNGNFVEKDGCLYTKDLSELIFCSKNLNEVSIIP